jgi:hypothetical protein
MTREEIQALEDRRLDAYIAQVLGWANVRKEDHLVHEGVTYWVGDNPEDGEEYCIPHYSDDFNALWMAETKLTPEQWVKYLYDCLLFGEEYKCPANIDFARKACKRCNDEFGRGNDSDGAFYNLCGAFSFAVLSPRQRAEALLMALTEVKP